MNIETVFFKATDGVDLNGILYKTENKTKKIIISVHGMATNCIKVRDLKIAEKANEMDVDLLSFNNRGHDIVNHIIKEETKKKELAGTAFEEISECYEDIVGVINYVKSLGYEEIYIMGHSLGSTKTVYFYNKALKDNKELLNNIKGIILLSLVDIPLAIQVYLKDNFSSMLTYAKNMSKEKMDNILMPEESFIHPISIKTFLRYAINNEDINFAKFSDDTSTFEELNNINVPLFMRWGNVRELIIQHPDELCELMKNKIKNELLDVGYIDGANHSYKGKEEILANQIYEFINNIKL